MVVIHVIGLMMLPSPKIICPCPNPQNYTCELLEKRVFADVIKFILSKWGLPRLSKWPLNSILMSLWESFSWDTQSSRAIWRRKHTSQGMSGATGNWELQRWLLPESFQRKTNPLILDSWFPELGKNTFLLFQASQWVVICYGNAQNHTVHRKTHFS